ncbi:MAG: hypothetical protein MJZ27_04835 [Bacteroidales bacterium]|nr:hypothetical protein [Bacteroidales bacterium]
MAKYILAKVVSGKEVIDYELMQRLGMSSYIIMNGDNTADIEFEAGHLIKAEIKDGAFIVGGDKLVYEGDDKVIFVKMRREEMTFIREDLLESYLAESLASAKAEEEARNEAEMAQMKKDFEVERKTTPLRYNHLGTVAWTEDGEQTTERATAPATIEIYGKGEGKHLIVTNIADLGEGYWKQSDIFDDIIDVYFGEIKMEAKFEDDTLFLSDTRSNYHCLKEGGKKNGVLKLMWD